MFISFYPLTLGLATFAIAPGRKGTTVAARAASDTKVRLPVARRDQDIIS
ncbi:hypothetical protein P6U16_05795 [Rhizobium sp. 32-5/1]|nr:hypothetical protein [Rhizobium sp. 32-5/1]WEZ84193.1 hypothetical protein P6U16_05795 [Rhizobium sp. 32-5/1]